MDRNNVIGFILLGVLIIVFFLFQSRNANEARVEEAAKQEAAKQHTADSIKRVQDSLYLINNPLKKDSIITTIENAPVLVPDSLKKNLSTAAVKKLEDSLQLEQKKAIYGPFTASMQGTEKRDSLENEVLKIIFSNKGGRIIKAELKKFKDYHGGPVDLINGNSNRFNYNFYYTSDKNINTEDLYFQSQVSADKQSVVFTADLGNGSILEQSYSFTATDYLLDYNLKMTEFQQIIPARDPIIVLSWKNDMQQQEKNSKYERQYSKLYFGETEGDVDYKNSNGELKFENKIKWVSCQQQFFNTTLIAKNSFEDKGNVAVFAEDTSLFVKECNTELYIAYNNKNAFEFPMQWYLAPNDYNALSALNIGLETIIPTGSGLIGWINKWAIMPLFHFLGKFI
ncbi:MAG: membrane protein insertase YidC, partial [Chitinophagales bacterium]